MALSSGSVMDKSTVLDSEGNMRFENCPLTRKPLEKALHPVNYLKGKLTDWRLQRFDQALELAEVYEDQPEEFEELCEFANTILEEMGDDTYNNRASRLAKLQLTSKSID